MMALASNDASGQRAEGGRVNGGYWRLGCRSIRESLVRRNKPSSQPKSCVFSEQYLPYNPDGYSSSRTGYTLMATGVVSASARQIPNEKKTVSFRANGFPSSPIRHSCSGCTLLEDRHFPFSETARGPCFLRKFVFELITKRNVRRIIQRRLGSHRQNRCPINRKQTTCTTVFLCLALEPNIS
jgi:hypothetical protein